MSDYTDPDVAELQRLKIQLQPASSVGQRAPQAAQQQSSGDPDLDQLRALRAQATMPSTPGPQGVVATTASRGVLGNATDAASAVSHHIGNFFHGAAQTIENGVGAGIHWAAPGSAVDHYAQDTVSQDNAAMKSREAAYQASTPNSAGAYTGAAVGEVAPWLVGGAAKAAGAVGDIAAAGASKLGALWAPLGGKVSQTVARGVGQGATISAAAPVTGDGDYWSQKEHQVGSGAAIGGAVPIAAKAIGGAVSQVGGALAPWTNPKSLVGPLLEKVSGMDSATLATALRNYKTLVPGSVPTTAQLIKTPAAVMAERTMANTGAGKVAMAERQNANNAARLDFLQQHAGSDADLHAAISQRSSEALPYLDTLKAAPPVDATPILDHLDGITQSSLGTDPVIRSALSDARAILKAQSAPGANGEPMVSPDILDGIRQNVRGYLEKYASNGAVSSRQEAALGPLKDTIVDTVDAGVPGYRDYLAAYAKNSVPVNSMEQLQKLASALDTRAADSSGNPLFTITRAQQAVGQIDRAKNPISPEASGAVDNILSDLQRESVSNSVRAGSGSDTALNLQSPSWLASQLYGDSFSGRPGVVARGAGGALGWLAGTATDQGVAGSGAMAGAGAMAASKLAGAASSRVNAALADALMNPETAAAIAEQRAGNSNSAYTTLLANALRRAPAIAPYVDQLPGQSPGN